DELVDDIHITGVNQSQGGKTVPSTGVDQDNQPREKETVLSTGIDQGGETVLLTSVDQSNQPGEKEIALSMGVDQSNQSQGDETFSLTSADQNYQPRRRNPPQNLKLNKFFRVSKGKVGKIVKDVQFHINKKKLKNQQDEDEGDEDLPDCEKCYGVQKQFCKFCGCFRCERKSDPAHILLCDGNCGNGYHTYCLNPPIDEIPSGNWYCDKCRSLNTKQIESEFSGSKGKKVVLASDEIQIPLERNDSLGLSQPMSGIVISSQGLLTDIDSS
ncbi:12178_t:CDS:2, partial [Acaulospora morrowiae]